MEHVSVFDERQSSILETARREGGIFLKLYNNLSDPIEVMKNNEKGSPVSMKVLDRDISNKIYELYQNKALYKAPLEDGAYMISLAWLIVEHC